WATVRNGNRADRPRTAAAYNALPGDQGGLRLAVPLVRNHHTAADLVTGLQVLNPSPEGPAAVTLRFFDADGNPIPAAPDHSAQVPSGLATTWYLPTVNG